MVLHRSRPVSSVLNVGSREGDTGRKVTVRDIPTKTSNKRGQECQGSYPTRTPDQLDSLNTLILVSASSNVTTPNPTFTPASPRQSLVTGFVCSARVRSPQGPCHSGPTYSTPHPSVSLGNTPPERPPWLPSAVDTVGSFESRPLYPYPTRSLDPDLTLPLLSRPCLQLGSVRVSYLSVPTIGRITSLYSSVSRIGTPSSSLRRQDLVSELS